MQEVILILILNALFIVGFHQTTREGEINNWVDSLLWKLPEWVKKPLYDCPTCCASVHSTYIYWYNYDWNLNNILIYIVYVFALSALGTVINLLIEYMRANYK